MREPAVHHYVSYLTLRMPLSEKDLISLSKARKVQDLRACLRPCCPDVEMKVNLQLAALEISGTSEEVQLAQHILAQRIGPQKDLSAGLWSEMIRTRQDELGLLRQIQCNTGARLHLERDAFKVRLFGPLNAVAVASAQLDQLEQKCIEVRLWNAAKLEKGSFDSLADQLGVTVRLEMNQIHVRGFKSPVQKAVAVIEGMISNQPPDAPGHAAHPNKSSHWVQPVLLVPTQVFAPVQLVVVGSMVGFGPR